MGASKSRIWTPSHWRERKNDTISERSFSVRHWRDAAVTHAALDAAHLMVPEHERADAVWRVEEEYRWHFGARADRATAHVGGRGVCVSAIRANDSAEGDLRDYRADEGHREGVGPVGNAGAQVAGRGNGSARGGSWLELFFPRSRLTSQAYGLSPLRSLSTSGRFVPTAGAVSCILSRFAAVFAILPALPRRDPSYVSGVPTGRRSCVPVSPALKNAGLLPMVTRDLGRAL